MLGNPRFTQMGYNIIQREWVAGGVLGFHTSHTSFNSEPFVSEPFVCEPFPVISSSSSGSIPNTRAIFSSVVRFRGTNPYFSHSVIVRCDTPAVRAKASTGNPVRLRSSRILVLLTILSSVPNAMQKMQPPQHYFGGVSRKTVSFAGFLGNNCVRIVYAINPMVGWVLFCWVSSVQNKSSRINFPRIGTSYSPLGGWWNGVVRVCCSARGVDGVSFARILLLSAM
jgi:hypothetical protein